MFSSEIAPNFVYATFEIFNTFPKEYWYLLTHGLCVILKIMPSEKCVPIRFALCNLQTSSSVLVI